MDFLARLLETGTATKYILLGVEHLSGWPTMKATEQETADVAIEFVQVKLLEHFCAPRNIVPDNVPAFVAMAYRQFLRTRGISWRRVGQYSPQANGKVKWSFGTMRRALGKVVRSSSRDWSQVIPSIFHMYRARSGRDEASPFNLIFGTTTRWYLSGDPFIEREKKSSQHPEVRLGEVARA